MVLRDVKGIVWDLDGTLLNSFGVFQQILREVITETGHPMPSDDTLHRNYHGSLEETLQRLLGLSSPEELDSVLSLFLQKQERHYAGNLASHLFTDAVALAKQAAALGIHQLLVTNRAHAGRGSASPKAIVATTVLAAYIHDINTGDEVAYRKPDSRSLGTWLDTYRLDPASIIVIGDQFVDAQLAINIGAKAILVERGEPIPHLENLSGHDQKLVTLVKDLSKIQLA